MRVVILGAGSVGSFVGATLARAGNNVVLVGRGEHIRAVRERGLSVRATHAAFDVRIAALESPAEPEGDVLVVAVKAHALGAVAEVVAAYERAGATVVTLQNGVPFWFFDGFGGPLAGARLESLDHGGTIARTIGLDALVAGVVDAGTRIPEPSVVEQVGPLSFTFGAPVALAQARARAVAGAFSEAGLDARYAADVRSTVWNKLVGNAALNPLSALTRATIEDIVADEGTRDVLRAGMLESLAIGRALGLTLPDDVDARIAAAPIYGDQQTSMLQDVLRGRPLEIDPILAAPLEIAARLSVDVPVLRLLFALVRM